MHLLRHAWRALGLGLMVAGAVLHRPLGAQVRDTTKKRDTTLTIPIPARADSALRDSLAKKGPPPAPKDSIKAPFAHSELPADVGIARVLHWNRDSLFATGAITLADLLERVPGLTTFRAGWIAAPMAGAYFGDFRRLRVFYDNVEVTALDPRGNGVLDLTQINLWSAEDVVIEQAATEVRIHLRSWRVKGTTAVTRTDIATGDQQTNLYRGFFGRRFDNGLGIQFGAQQFGTTPPSVFGNSSDQLGLIARVGWARGRWSVDAFATRSGRHRGEVFGDQLQDTIPAVESTRSDAYVRVGLGDPDTSRVWGQLMAVASKYDYTGFRPANLPIPQTPEDSALAFASLDTAAFRGQYVATAGFNRGPFRVSATERLFHGFGSNRLVPSLRASFSTRFATISAFAERQNIDSISRGDVTAQVTPFSFISVVASVGRAHDSHVVNETVRSNYARGEVGLRVHNLWLAGGVLRRDSAALTAPRIFDTLFTSQGETSATGVTAAIRGQLWRLIHADISAVRWNDTAGFYRPRYQTRSELFVRTNLLDRFPSNNLGILFSAVHEYRSGVRFPRQVADSVIYQTTGYRTISTLLEIRILSATISWQFRNVLGERYSQVPPFIAPRQTNFYGVRWEFFN